jgi:hypothetical protein
MKEKKYQEMVNQEYLNAKQLTILSIVVLAFIQQVFLLVRLLVLFLFNTMRIKLRFCISEHLMKIFMKRLIL